MTKLETARQKLAAAEKEYAALNTERQRLERELACGSHRKQRFLHLMKICQAGKIFAEAGILETYDHEDVLRILKDYGRNRNV